MPNLLIPRLTIDDSSTAGGENGLAHFVDADAEDVWTRVIVMWLMTQSFVHGLLFLNYIPMIRFACAKTQKEV